jgi:NADPH2:quinone reductase
MTTGSNPVRAARLVQHGEPVIVESVTLPAPGDGEVRVELEFGGVNPIDRYTAEGRVNPQGPLPRTLGAEAAGHLDGRTVMVAGAGLGGVRDGVWAQAAVVPADAVLDVPEGVTTQQAAAMGIAGLTAMQCVRELARVTAEDRVLVLGAAGGVGSMIVSLARVAGATVWGQTGSPEKAAAIVQDGAERVVVGGAEEIAREITEFEPTVAFDPLAGGFVAPLMEAVAPRGRIVQFGVSAGPEVTFNMQLLYRKMISLLGYGGMLLEPERRRAGLEAALEAVRVGDLKVRIDEVLGLEHVNEAFQRLVDRKVQGNLLLDLT